MVRLHNALPMADDKAALSLPISFNAAIWYIVDVQTNKASSHKDSAIRDFPIKTLLLETSLLNTLSLHLVHNCHTC